MERRKTRLGSIKSAFRTLHRGIYGQGTVLPGTRLPCGTTVSRRSPVPRPATSVAEPRIGPGRETLSLRVCACEAQPRTPHPTGLGYPAPAKLSLCPTSVTPLEAPLTGQDASRISEVLRAGIGIHSQVRERAPRRPSCPGRNAARSSCEAVRCRAGVPVTLFEETGVPVLRSSASRRATRCIAPGTRQLVPQARARSSG
jgi:hypothetical protein